MRVAIIDDERLARSELRRLLDAHPEVEVVAEAAHVADGLHAIRHMAPDLVFLDIRMPDGSGFELLAALERAPAVIFTTAYDQFALKAFDANALDYLLKPIEPPRLAQALKKYSRDAAPTPQKATDGKVFIQDGERCWFVDVEQIVLFESEGNYTRVYFDHNRPLLLRSLNQLEERLDPQHFMRVSRRHIVNLRYVRSVEPSPAGGLVLQLESGLNVDMSRRRAVQFKQLKRL
ncbi:LytR/AlgR family response regulator transcription factor [Polyangium jinanense]|uniref:Response regulator transcription factor n=1 Tax=Polyangium jinanense TaxID=2829994 RepID=A0A9X3X8T7_9BACT|nr:LytTR family DNA-binding domain-containing protein [Polyangium jinanense]MDC3958935.1 response regulator transcription factor [Polyangium jinanense]MDC3986049.1 response regulator transcription factor [Polyangium jinanense]